MSSERKPPDDGELEDFLAGKHPVGRAYRDVSGQETAPRELDDAILRMAREHAAATPPPGDAEGKSTVHVMTPRRRPRWLQPLAVAATLALSLGVLMNIWRDPALREQAAPVKEEVQAPSESRPAAPAPIPQSNVEAGAPREGRNALQTLSPSLEIQRDFAAPEPPRPEPLESRRAAQPFPGGAASTPAQRNEPSTAGAVSPSATAPRADSATAAAPPPPPPAPAPQASGAGPSRPDLDPRDERYRLGHPESDDAGLADRKLPFAKSLSPRASASAPAMAEQEQKKKRQAEDTRELAKEKTIQKSMAADAAAPVEAESAVQEQAGESREALIERARAAVARGDGDEARRWVADLHRLYPDAALPEDLRPFAPPGP